MKFTRAMSVVAVFAFVSPLLALANEILWKGGGSTSAWSDGSNWQGGVAPGNGDMAVIPDGKTVYVSSTDLSWIAAQGLSMISLPGADSTLFVTNNASANITVPVSGIGKFNVSNNNNRLEFNVDNSAFTGPFLWINSYVANDWDHPNCYGINNVITNVVGDGLASQYLSYPDGYSNIWYIFGGTGATTGGNRSLLTYSSRINLCGPVYVDGNYRLSSQQGTTLTLKGGLFHSGDHAVCISGSVKITGDIPCEFLTTRANFSGLVVEKSAVLELDSPITASSPRVGGPGTLRFCRPYLLSQSTSLQDGNAGNVSGMIIDLNGFNQQCGYIQKMTNTGTTEDITYITSSTPATLTAYGETQNNGSLYRPHRYISLSIRGAASFEFKARDRSDGVWPEMEIRNCPTKSDTSGGLRSSRGTLTLAETTYWPNLTRLEAIDEGKLVLNTDGVNTNGFVFVASNVVNSAVTIAANKCLHAKSAYVDGWLEPGEYGGAGAGLDAAHTLSQLGGSGTLLVAEWGGRKGMAIIFR